MDGAGQLVPAKREDEVASHARHGQVRAQQVLTPLWRRIETADGERGTTAQLVGQYEPVVHHMMHVFLEGQSRLGMPRGSGDLGQQALTFGLRSRHNSAIQPLDEAAGKGQENPEDEVRQAEDQPSDWGS